MSEREKPPPWAVYWQSSGNWSPEQTTGILPPNVTI